MNNNQIDVRLIDNLMQVMKRADSILMKKYLNDIDKYPICQVPKLIDGIPLGSNFQLFKVLKVVYDKKEQVLDKLITVFNTISTYDNCSLVMIIQSEGNFINFYLGTICRDIYEDNHLCNVMLRGKQSATLKASLLGNFPGTELKSIKLDNGKEDNLKILNDMFLRARCVSLVNGVSGFRQEKSNSFEDYIQGIEKFIDTMMEKKYVALFIADVISTKKIEVICSAYEDLYSQLVPFLQSNQTLTMGDSTSEAESFIKGVTDTTNESLSKAITKGESNSIGTAKGVAIGVSYGVSLNYNYSKNSNYTKTESQTDSFQEGISRSLTEQNSITKTLTTNTAESIQISYQNRAVKTLLDRIDEQIKRLRSCQDYGVFDFGAYFISEDTPVSISAASTYKSLIRGENSSIESSSIITWEDEEAEQIFHYLKKMYHPLIAVGNFIGKERYDILSPTTLVSGKELSIHMGLPKKSVSGIPVLECVEFGRDIISYDNKTLGQLDLGNIYHMHNEVDRPVKLDIDSLTSHTFITGSTGSGKSNTIYTILNYLLRVGNNKGEKIPFLIIEPAKGEYKKVFGHDSEVQVYGTNPYKTDLLKLNPFKFPKDIHILEHLDRLIEIFNVCWPMYAAMPAVLKDAMERAYIEAGWDLKTSINNYSSELYPSFHDVLNQIQVVMNESAYSADNKGDYIGALATRLKSLTNGLNGMIFCNNDLKDEELFNRPVIIDLSRVGSTETKALIMGLLVMRLQEFRLSTCTESNTGLRHITVLEEAHHLLKRTSTEQNSETSNLLGKSVELIANAIAEMRSYGEGFIIADQSPSLLDLSVIRNTNTKIILRLPDYSDRELVGKSANLNENQINELAKLCCGVAAVYQNDWIQPVLCKVHKCNLREENYIKPSMCYTDSDDIKKFILNIIMNKALNISDISVRQEIINRVVNSDLSTKVKCHFIRYLRSNRTGRLKEFKNLVYELFNSTEVIMKAKAIDNLTQWVEAVKDDLHPSIKDFDGKIVDVIIGIILQECSIRQYSYRQLYLAYMESIKLKGGVY